MTDNQEKLLNNALKTKKVNFDDITKNFADTDPERKIFLDKIYKADVEIVYPETIYDVINSDKKQKEEKMKEEPSINNKESKSKKTPKAILDDDIEEELDSDEDSIDDFDLDDDYSGDDEEVLDEELKEYDEDLAKDPEQELDEISDDDFYNLSDEDVPEDYSNFDDILYSAASNSRQRIQVDDSVRMYLKEIGRVPLLTKEREIEIAKIIYDSKQYNDEFEKKVNEGYIPTMEEVEENNRIKFQGEIASNQLVEANLRLVVHIAKGFVASGMDFLDLIQEGSNGLMKAVSKFDYTRGNKFSTYATGWIKQAITRAIADQGRTIRIPVHMNETINRLNRKERELTHELGRKPTVDELAEVMDYPVDKILMIKRVSQKTKSLEDPVGEEEDSTYGDFIADDFNPNPEEYASNEALKRELNVLLSNLSDREERVIKLRFGLIDGRTRTLEEVGKEYNVTRERIRQIEAKALRKLRHPSRANKVKDFVK